MLNKPLHSEQLGGSIGGEIYEVSGAALPLAWPGGIPAPYCGFDGDQICLLKTQVSLEARSSPGKESVVPLPHPFFPACQSPPRRS